MLKRLCMNWLWILGIAALCLLSRLPQLTSPYLHADYNGDECVLGLMANHLAAGKEFPFYFWGQKYGFCWIEEGAIALAIKFFGIGVLSLKVPMLLLWTTGCVFFYGALARWTTKSHGFWITCLLIFSPAWMDWSMKARAGYVTAFLLSSIVLFLFAANRQSMKKWVCLFIGLLLGFIFLAQPTFLLGVLPLLVYGIGRQKNFKSVFICIAGFAGVFILGKVMAHLQANTDVWHPDWFGLYNASVSFSSFKQRVFNALNQDSGKYWASALVSNAWCAVFLAGLGIHIFGLITRKTSALATVFLISIVLILGSTFVINGEYRYFLSLSVFLVLWFGVLSFECMNKNIFLKVAQGLVVAALLVLGIFVAWNYKDFYRTRPAPAYEVPEMQKINALIGFLKNSGVKYVFSLDQDLSWKLSFFSGEQVISRWALMQDRQPAYTEAITEAFLQGQEVALVGNVYDEMLAYMIAANEEGRPEFFADQYFVYLKPSPELIFKKLRFQFYRLPTSVSPIK